MVHQEDEHISFTFTEKRSSIKQEYIIQIIQENQEHLNKKDAHSVSQEACNDQVPICTLCVFCLECKASMTNNTYRQDNYSSGSCEYCLAMPFRKFMDWLQSKGKGHGPSKSCLHKKYLSFKEKIQLHSTIAYLLTTVPKSLLVFWGYLAMCWTNQIDQVSTTKHICRPEVKTNQDGHAMLYKIFLESGYYKSEIPRNKINKGMKLMQCEKCM